jgi:hypothetical protein
MATVGPSRLIDRISWYTDHARHRVWDRFGPAEQERMLRDDMTAGRNVSLVLFAIVTTGMLLSIITVLAVVLLQ